MDRLPSDNHRIVIRADKTPTGEHSRRFHAPTIDGVAIVIVGDQFQSRDIILHRRNEQLQRVSELHRCYDALQYPILHWNGHDGYHINIPMINPSTGLDAQKKVSAMNYYSYRLMIREGSSNYILRCGNCFINTLWTCMRKLRLNVSITSGSIKVNCDQKNTYICVMQ
ncbi:uncharacterized protein LOC120780616 [Bactrocera tryoni]|uniref:uncharacterized protein LOC120780616 n=1 Tax=Bactrocera tryoni TaxID=59916 RepID=UPI001A979564|nr:uncharacterized protein LOC120780616 [Bactrocera tryoni]